MLSVQYEKRALKALYELSQATMGAETITEIFDNILDKSMRIIGVEKASIMRFDPREGALKIIASRGIPQKVVKDISVVPGHGISGKVFSSQKPLLVKDAKSRKDTLKEKRYKSKSLISAPVTCLPMKVRGRPVGVVNMTDKKNGEPFTSADLELLTTIAAQAAAYIHIYDLIDDLKEADRVRNEIEMAREIQLALLPDDVPALRGVDVAGRSLMADRIGGDYYDILSSGWTPPAFVIADVSGHDIGAALLMSAFRSALRSEVGIPVLPPSAVLRRMNRVLYNDLVKAEQFISVSYMQYIHSSRTLRYSSAGHHPVWLYCGRKKTFVPLVTDGPLLGIERGEHFYEKKTGVSKGDVVVMYTDGLIEAKNSKGQQYGIARLKKSIKKHSGKTPSLIVDGVCRDLEKYVAELPLKDDVTILILKFK